VREWRVQGWQRQGLQRLEEFGDVRS